MKDNYTRPELEIIEIDSEDIIVCSNELPFDPAS